MRYLIVSFTLCAMIALLFVPETSAQFLPHEACDYTQGLDGKWAHNTGSVLNAVHDPANPTTSFYTVSHNAVCYVEDAFGNVNEKGFYDVVFTSEEAGYGIRDIAVSKSGAMAVIVENKRQWDLWERDWLPHPGATDDQMVFFRNSHGSEFYAIKDIGYAGMGRIEDVWLNGEGNTLVAVSASKVGTWERSGDAWSKVDLTAFLDIGLPYFPSVHDYQAEGREGCSRGGRDAQIVGHPDGEMIFVDFYRNARGRSCGDLADGDGRLKNYLAFIESSTTSWEWREPVFIEESWCPREDDGNGWEVQPDPHDPSVVWAMCARGNDGHLARHLNGEWRQAGILDLPIRAFTGVGGGRHFFMSPSRDGQMYVFWGWDFARINKTGDGWSIVEGRTGDAMMGGFGRVVLIDSADGSLIYFDWSTREEYVSEYGRSSGRDIRISDLAIRKSGEVMASCMTRSRDMIVTLARHTKTVKYESIRPGFQVVFWEADGSRATRLLGSTYIRKSFAWSGGWELRCEPSAFMGHVLVSHNFSRIQPERIHLFREHVVLRFSLSTLRVVPNDPYTHRDYYRALMVDPHGGEVGAPLCLIGRGDYIKWGSFVGWDMDDPSEGECGESGRIHYRLGDGIVVMNPHGVHWADPRDGPSEFWYNRVTVSDHNAWQAVGLCGSLDAPAAMFWRSGVMPQCVDIAIPARVARAMEIDAQALRMSNYPNPFRASTQLSFDLPYAASVSINIYDVTGRLVERHQLGVMAGGAQVVSYNGAHLPPGIYIVRLVTDGYPVHVSRTMTRI